MLPRTRADIGRRHCFAGQRELVESYLREEIPAPNLHFANTFPKAWFDCLKKEEQEAYISENTRFWSFAEHQIFLAEPKNIEDLMLEYPMSYYESAYLLPLGYTGPRVCPPTSVEDPGPGNRRVLDLSGT